MLTLPLTGSSRRPLVIGNWKMNGDHAANDRLLDAIGRAVDAALLAQADVGVCPPFPYIAQVAAVLGKVSGSGSMSGSHRLSWGAQNVARTASGAFTGEVSATMLADLRCTWVLIGHSERRQLFGETDSDVAAKVSISLANGLRPVICVGETLAEREAGITEKVLGAQLAAVLPGLADVGADRYVLAYEPVWAIGTGKTATPEQAQEVHGFLRASLAKGLSGGAEVAAALRILYGGSVKGANAAELFAGPDVDGGLIGGAALVADDFAAICKAAAQRFATRPSQ